MIRRLEFTELMAVLIIERSKGLTKGFRKLSYKRIFDISHRVIHKFDMDVRFDGLTTINIKQFCNWLIDKGKINIIYDENGLTLYPLTDNNVKFIRQYAPFDKDYNIITKANF